MFHLTYADIYLLLIFFIGYAIYWRILNLALGIARWILVFNAEELNFVSDTAFGSCSKSSLALLVIAVYTDVDVD